MTIQQLARRRGPRWVALLAILLVTGMLASTSALAAHFPVTFATADFTEDVQGANDEPGQKDLTAQASKTDPAAPNHFFTAWKWDDTSWSGNNTGDGCSLFDTNDDGFVEYAVCATVEDGQGAAEVELDTVTFYSCNNKWDDRCGNPVLLLSATGSDAEALCEVTDLATGTFNPATDKDTQIVCDITAIATAAETAGKDVDPADFVNGTLLNTCSYPSREPNSDPSDCVLVTSTDVTVSTQSGGSIVWTATLTDTATLNPSTATGSVTFFLYSDSTCTAANLVASSTDTDAPYTASQTVTNLTADAGNDGKFYWIATYTPTGAFNGDSSACGEETTITLGGVFGSSGS